LALAADVGNALLRLEQLDRPAAQSKDACGSLAHRRGCSCGCRPDIAADEFEELGLAGPLWPSSAQRSTRSQLPGDVAQYPFVARRTLKERSETASPAFMEWS